MEFFTLPALKFLLTIIAAVTGAMSAWYWLRSSRASKKSEEGVPTTGGTSRIQLTMDDGTGFFQTLEAQAFLNRKAAAFAAGAAASTVAASIVEIMQQF